MIQLSADSVISFWLWQESVRMLVNMAMGLAALIVFLAVWEDERGLLLAAAFTVIGVWLRKLQQQNHQLQQQLLLLQSPTDSGPHSADSGAQAETTSSGVTTAQQKVVQQEVAQQVVWPATPAQTQPASEPEEQAPPQPDPQITASSAEADNHSVVNSQNNYIQSNSAQNNDSQNNNSLDYAWMRVRGWLTRFFTEGNLVARVGILVLFVGVAFLFSFAARQGLLPIGMRFIGVGVLAAGIFALGWWLRQRQRIFALLAQGAGLGLGYLSLFAAARLYQLLPMNGAFVAMLLCVAASVALALRQDARGLALFAALGGYLAPVLMSSGDGSHIALFSYYALLNTGLLATAWYKSWRELNLCGFLFTFIVAGIWGGVEYERAYLISSEIFLLLFFLMFLAVAVLFALRQPPQLKGVIDASLVFALPLVVMAYQSYLLYYLDYWLAGFSLACGLLYLGLSLWLKKRQPLQLLARSFYAMALVFIALAVPLALSQEWSVMTWSVQGAALVWLGLEQQNRLNRLFGYGLLTISLMWLLVDGYFIPLQAMYLLHGKGVAALVMVTALLLAAYQLQQKLSHCDSLLPEEKLAQYFLFSAALLLWLLIQLREIVFWLTPDFYAQAWVALLTVTAALLYAGFRRFDWPLLRYPLLALVPLLSLLALATMVEEQRWLVNWASAIWFVALPGCYYLLYQFREVLPQRWAAIFHSLLLTQLLLFSGLELLHQVNNRFAFIDDSGWPELALLLPVLSCCGWLLWQPDSSRWPLDKQLAMLRQRLLPSYLALLSLFVCLCLLTADGGMVPYFPLLNALDGLGVVVLVLLLLWWRSGFWRAHGAWPDTQLTGDLLPIWSGLFAATLVNTVLARYMTHYQALPFELDVLWQSAMFQTLLALVWTLIGLTLTLLASKKALRLLWFVGAAILALVVFKLFLVDLSGHETIARIVSFIAVGLLLMAVGYFSPLPPQESQQSRN